MPIESGKAQGRLGLGALLAALAGIYVTQTLVTTIAMQSLPALLRQAGASLQLVGLSSLFMLPWALRFLWAPAVERWRLPMDRVQRRSRTLILRGQWLLAAGMVVVAGVAAAGGLSLQAHGAGLLALFFLAAVLAATVDIACGGFAVDQLTQDRRGWGNTAKVGGSYLGMLLGGSAFLLLADRHGWPLALGAGGAAIVLLSLPLLAVSEPQRSQAAHGFARPSLGHALRRPQVRRGLLLAFALGAGVRTAIGMVGPLLLDKGASMAELAWLFGAFSVGAGLAGTACGGLLVRWAQGWRAVWMAVVLEAAVLASLAWGAMHLPLAEVTVLVGLLFASMACGFVAIYSALMGLASPSQPGVDFALFQCADALMAMLGGMAGGWLAQHSGYGACFALAAALAAGAAGLALHAGQGLGAAGSMKAEVGES
ncbi:MFS transporter [Comamonas composti]|uniref:MFS transporter n=1 Tax=Comamonas composti TaxID=408558 RepID=UPI0004276229|nr:MFS transporter [Comamonas composti]